MGVFAKQGARRQTDLSAAPDEPADSARQPTWVPAKSVWRYFWWPASHSRRTSEENIFLSQLRRLSKPHGCFQPLQHAHHSAAGWRFNGNSRTNLQPV